MADFRLNARFTPALYRVAKMDGAIILNKDAIDSLCQYAAYP